MLHGTCRTNVAGQWALLSVLLLGWVPLHAVEDLRWGPLFPSTEGCGGTIYGMTAGPDDIVFVGGDLTNCGGVAVQNVAAYHVDSDTWTALGNGLNDRVNALTWYDGALYAGGMFTQINGGGIASRVARWDPDSSQWTPVGNNGNGVDDRVLAMAVMDGALYVGGEFQNANNGSNSLPASHVARWDGSNWSALESADGQGVSSLVWALVAEDSRLYVGGTFSEANVGDPIEVNGVAYWEAGNWFGLPGDGGVGAGTVRAIGVLDGDVYVGGDFLQANTGNPINASRVARWDGSDWHALADMSGQGVDASVRAMIVFDGSVYIAGIFETFGDVDPVTTNRIARWDGDQWHTLGSGLGPSWGRALTGYGDRLVFVGGQFGSAGGQSSNSIAAYQTRGLVEIELVGNGNGTVIDNGGLVDCPGDCDVLFEWGASVELTSAAAPNSDFIGFSGAGCTNDPICTFDLEQDVTITAEFNLKTYTVTIDSVSGQGQFTVDPSSVEHGDDAGGTLVPDPGWSVYSLAGDTCMPEDNGDDTWQASGITQDCAVAVEFRPDVSLELTTDSQPALIGQPVTYTVEVTATDGAPVDGTVTVSAGTGELCLDDGVPVPVAANTVAFECQIQFSGTGSRLLTADYDGSSTHMPGTSNNLVQNVVGSFEIFDDRFEAQ